MNSDESNEPYKISQWFLGEREKYQSWKCWFEPDVWELLTQIRYWSLRNENFEIEVITQNVYLETLGKFPDHTPLTGTSYCCCYVAQLNVVS